MATQRNISTQRSSASFTYNTSTVDGNSNGLWAKYVAFVDDEKPRAVAWWLGSLMLHGCILVPLTFLLVYSLNGPTGTFLSISMGLFFINVIANMGSASFRFTFNSLMVSVIIHLLMVATVLTSVI
ncbi:MAG: hypothetical protein WBJ10_10525 [Daejeonella sp.]|uniref:hypothetical protein n=1 Tax=Daejeonella sp. TaxID=2805397 RepID=UPI003C72734F